MVVLGGKPTTFVLHLFSFLFNQNFLKCTCLYNIQSSLGEIIRLARQTAKRAVVRRRGGGGGAQSWHQTNLVHLWIRQGKKQLLANLEKTTKSCKKTRIKIYIYLGSMPREISLFRCYVVHTYRKSG